MTYDFDFTDVDFANMNEQWRVGCTALAYIDAYAIELQWRRHTNLVRYTTRILILHRKPGEDMRYMDARASDAMRAAHRHVTATLKVIAAL
jgi:hypothetical protein